jgi:hypothetical protein
MFHLTIDGQLTLVGALPNPIKSLFRLTIQARDRVDIHTDNSVDNGDTIQLSSETLFTVIPLIGQSDIKFTQSEYRFEVSENAKVGNILGSVHIEHDHNAGMCVIIIYPHANII